MTTLSIVHYYPGMRLELGGVVRAVLDNCEVLSDRGHRITLVTDDSRDIRSEFDGTSLQPRVVTLAHTPGVNGFLTTGSLAQLEGLLQPGDVLHLHAPWRLSNLQVAKIALRKQIPYVFSAHGMLDHWAMNQRGLKKRLFLDVFGRRMIRSARRVHYTAEGEHEQAIHYVGRNPSSVIPYIVDLAPFASLPDRGQARMAFPDLAADVPNVLFLSRLHEKKGVEPLLRAADLLHRRKVSFRLIIAGSGNPGYEARLKSLVASLNLQSIVRFVGFVQGVKKVALYRAADLFVLPTLQENFGLALVESLAAETPVLTTQGTDIWREIQSAGGYLCTAEPAQIANFLAEILIDCSALRERGQRGRSWVFEHLSVDAIAPRYEEMYAETRS